jgi:hypothetical protein
MPNVVAPDRVVLMRREYHEDERPWRRSKNLQGKWIGIELEAEHDDGYGVILQKIAIPRVDECDVPIFEEDGTIDDYEGVEIVFPPVKAESIMHDLDHYVRRAIKSVKASGAHFPDNCGMHISVNTNGWNNYKKAAFMLGIVGMPPGIMEKLGGRDVRWNESAASIYPSLNDRWGYADNRWTDFSYMPGSDHDHCAEWRDDGKSCEIRFPKATADMRRLNKLLFWIDALTDFADTIRADYRPADHYAVYKDFLSWLRNQGAEYAALKTYLSRA